MNTEMVNRPKVIEHGKFKMVIMDAPNDANVTTYVKELKMQGVTDVARTCEPTYNAESFEGEGISVHEMMFADGAPPPDELLKRWIDLVADRYQAKKGADAGSGKNGAGVVAVHCVAGLGRAPVMAAVALIEMTGIDPMDAVMLIRNQQKGAINAKQLKFLQNYKPMLKKGGHGNCACAIQ